MIGNKFDKKIRFSYFLPYGLISPLALRLSEKAPAYAKSAYTPDTLFAEKEAVCFRFTKRLSHFMSAMEKYGFTTTTRLKFTKSDEMCLSVTRLTQKGLYVLTNTPADPCGYDQPMNSNKKEISYLPMDEESCFLRGRLYKLAQQREQSQEAAEDFDNIFFNSVFPDKVGILAYEPYKATTITRTQNRNLRGYYLLKIWKLSNIDALMKASGYLTAIDRRPLIPYLSYLRELYEYDSTETENEPTNDAEKSGTETENEPSKNTVKYTTETANKPVLKAEYEYDILPVNDSERKERPDIYMFIRDTLNAFYHRFPEAKLYRNPWLEKDLLRDTRIYPAFYTIDELPGFRSVSDDCGGNLRGSNAAFRHSVAGILTGTERTYMVYHTKPHGTPWNPSVERRTIEKAETVMGQVAELTGRKEYGRVIGNALIVCPTVHQFASLFIDAREKMSARWARERRVGMPYDEVNIIPLNHSGLYQFSLIAAMTPEKMESFIMNGTIGEDGNRREAGVFQLRVNPDDEMSKTIFMPIQDPVYKAAYNNRPVLVAYAMNFQQLYFAWDDYLKGKRFYCLCFPEQAKFIRQIMPEIEFL